jgi:hypothetical protein
MVLAKCASPSTFRAGMPHRCHVGVTADGMWQEGGVDQAGGPWRSSASSAGPLRPVDQTLAGLRVPPACRKDNAAAATATPAIAR